FHYDQVLLPRDAVKVEQDLTFLKAGREHVSSLTLWYRVPRPTARISDQSAVLVVNRNADPILKHTVCAVPQAECLDDIRGCTALCKVRMIRIECELEPQRSVGLL